MIQAAEQLAQVVGTKAACDALGGSRSSLYRHRCPATECELQPRPAPARALSPDEKAQVRDVLNSERFQDWPRSVNGATSFAIRPTPSLS